MATISFQDAYKEYKKTAFNYAMRNLPLNVIYMGRAHLSRFLTETSGGDHRELWGTPEGDRRMFGLPVILVESHEHLNFAYDPKLPLTSPRHGS